MKTLEEVRSQVLGSMKSMGSEVVSLSEAIGRVLAEDVVSGENVPHFANSAMDGFAVRAEDVAQPGAILEIVGDVPAGQAADVAVEPGQAIRIMTGAPMPAGADAVVRVEDTSEDTGKVHISTSVSSGHYVRDAGGDIKIGQTVIESGTRLTPVHVGVLATIGVVQPFVALRPRVAVMSTGDELVDPAAPDLRPGMIRDSNRPMLVGLIQEAGAEVIDYGRIPDDPDALRAALGQAAAETDVIVTSGGVSMGDFDVTKLVLREDTDVEFMQVAMKPGKPFAFGKLGGARFFGLPGNPVSVLISFEQFVRPALLRMQRATRIQRPRVQGVAGERLETDPNKTVFLKVTIEDRDGTWVAHQTGHQGSNVLSGAARADAFAVVPRGTEEVGEGESVALLLIHSPASRGSTDV